MYISGISKTRSYMYISGISKTRNYVYCIYQVSLRPGTMYIVYISGISKTRVQELCGRSMEGRRAKQPKLVLYGC